MKISVITVVYNGEKTIRDCINSVLFQNYPDLEYIIVDGQSTDGTLTIVRSYGEKIHTVISGPDSGMYEAMNKGIEAATGDIVAILNSDDMYASSDVLEKVSREFEKNKEIGCVYGDLQYVDKNDTSIVRRIWKSKSYTPGLFKRGWHPAHPAFFVRKSVYEKYGLYNTDLRIASDYEMMLRFLEIKKIPSSYIPELLVKMRDDGMSNKSLFNMIKANIEVLKAWKINGKKIPYLLFLKKPLSKIKQVR